MYVHKFAKTHNSVRMFDLINYKIIIIYIALQIFMSMSFAFCILHYYADY